MRGGTTCPASAWRCALMQRMPIVFWILVIRKHFWIGPIQEFFEICVAVAIGVLGSIAWIFRIQPVLQFPHVRHAIAIGVHCIRRNLSAFFWRPTGHLVPLLI